MRPLELGLVYALVGLAVALAHWHQRRPGALWSLALWPLFLPGLLATQGAGPALDREGSWMTPSAKPVPTPQEAGTPGASVEAVLTALRESMRGWEAQALGEESVRAVESGLHELLARRKQLEDVRQRLPAGAAQGGDQLPALAAARRRHHAQLQALVDELDGRLEGDLAALTELTTEVLRARYTGAGADAVTAELARLSGVLAAVEEAGCVSPSRAGARSPGPTRVPRGPRGTES